MWYSINNENYTFKIKKLTDEQGDLEVWFTKKLSCGEDKIKLKETKSPSGELTITVPEKSFGLFELHIKSGRFEDTKIVPYFPTILKSIIEDLEKLFDHAIAKFGKIDFILHSIGMSVNVRKGKHYTELNYDWLEKGWDVSAVSFHRVMKLAWEKDCMNEWGSILALSYIAAQRTFPDYNDMADNKSYLESIARSFGYYWGERKVRVNTISQSPTMTTAGQGVKGFDGFIKFAEDMSPLGNATAAECADYCISLFSDLTRKVTMQNLFHDGGFSNTGVSTKVMERYNKG